MGRMDVAYLLMLLLAAGVGAAWFLSRRFVKYRRALMRGRRQAAPVWKPFWMN